ncbi:MAG: O-antigen ligase family protein [Polyangiaceae bacterium]|nr:O-antigen ligase family protein [Polyangiaceae bacterium]
MDAGTTPSYEHVGRRRRSRQRQASEGEPYGPLQQMLTVVDRHADRGAAVGLSLVVLGSALALGSVHRPVLLAVSLGALAVTLLAMRSTYWSVAPISLAAFTLAAYSLLQSVPMPITWLVHLSPGVADVWRRALIPFSGELLQMGSLSLDPGASRAEGLKWVIYGLIASVAGTVERRGHRQVVPLILTVSAGIIAAVTFVHWLVGAEIVYGLYRPHGGGIISPFVNANNLAGYLNFGLFCGLACMLVRESAAPRWLLAASGALVMAVSALLASRGGLISLALGLVAFSVGMVVRYSRQRRRMGASDAPLVILTSIAAGGALLWLSVEPGVITRLLNEGTEKIDLLSWTPALILDNAWFGVGRGAFETAFPPYHGGRGHLIYAHAENFLMQWAAEWGIPVTLGTVGAVFWILRPARTRIGERSASAAAALAVAVLLLHNMVDLALEVPAVSIALFALLGSLSARAAPDIQPVTSRTKHRVWLSSIGGIFAASLLGTAMAGPSAQAHREQLRESYESVAWSDPKEVEKFMAELRGAMVSHPGDAYLPLLGGLAARRGHVGVPLVWASRALERDPRDSHAHLFVAELLRGRRANEQAFLHLRLAAEYDPGAAHLAAMHALRWSADVSQLLRIVPEGPAGALSLLHLARLSTGGKFEREKLRLINDAVSRDPELYDAREMRAWLLVGELSAGLVRQADIKPTRRIIEHDAKIMRELAPHKSAALEVRALMLAALGRPEEGVAILEEGCGATASLSCYSRWLSVASQQEDETRLDRAATAFLTASCVEAPSCAEGEVQVAATFVSRGRPANALRHYEAAARLQPSVDAWLRVVSAAEQMGATHVIARALRNAAREAEADPRRKDEIAEKYRAIMGEVLNTP